MRVGNCIAIQQIVLQECVVSWEEKLYCKIVYCIEEAVEVCCNTNIVLQAGRLGWPVVSQYKRTVLWLEGLQEAKSYRNRKLYCDRRHGRWAGAGRRCWACRALGERALACGTGRRAAGGLKLGARDRGRAAVAADVRAAGGPLTTRQPAEYS